MKHIGTNAFVKRQTADSKFSHFEGSWEELEHLVEEYFGVALPGYRDGVCLVPVPPEGFYSGVVELTVDTPLKATFEARHAPEDAFVQVVALGGEKLPARAVNIVLYRHDVLAADGDATLDADGGHAYEWEIISINARPTEEEEPPTPMAMARNFLGLPGGTKAEYTTEEFARAIVYWSRRAMRS
jgi:hypothetical protein